jgi:hypothetical protein
MKLFLCFFIIINAFPLLSAHWKEVHDYFISPDVTARKYKLDAHKHIEYLQLLRVNGTNIYHIAVKFVKDSTKEQAHISALKSKDFTFYKYYNEFVYHGSNKIRINEFISIIDNIAPCNKSMFDFLGIRIVNHQTMLELAKSGEHEAAKKFVYQYGDIDEEVMWKLADFYYFRNEFLLALDLYQDIGQENPHFTAAGERCDIIISMRLDQTYDQQKKKN